MRFDPEIMRSILLTIEEMPAGRLFTGGFLDQEGKHDSAVLNEHAKILVDDKFLQGNYYSNNLGVPTHFIIQGLTMKGHEFLANARNNTVWKKVVAKAQSEGTHFSITILNGLLKKAMEKYVGLED